MYEDCIIVSVDESNIRSDKLGSYKWVFNSRDRPKRQRLAIRKVRRHFNSRRVGLFNVDPRYLNLPPEEK